MMAPTEELTRCGVAILIGAFVGLERQARFELGARFEGEEPDAPEAGADAPRAEPRAADLAREERVPDGEQVAGVRTFSILALIGAVAALSGSTWGFPLALFVVGLFLVSGYVLGARVSDDRGLTSEFAALTVFLLGGLCGEGRLFLAAAAALALALLLSIKGHLHAFASKLRRRDAMAVLKFAALSLVVLPLLPSEPIRLWPEAEPSSVAAVSTQGAPAPSPLSGPGAGAGQPAAPESPAPSESPASLAEVSSGGDPGLASAAAAAPQGGWWTSLTLDLRKIWWMVILISSVSFAGFVLGKVLGTEQGLLVTALIGGLVSSTAVTLTYAQRSREAPGLSRQLLIGILAANVIMPLRVLVVLAIAAPSLAARTALPMGFAAGVGGLFALGLRFRRQAPGGSGGSVQLENPFELRSALKFGGVFALILLLAQVASALLGEAGLYVLALVSGLTDVDAIVLAAADLIHRGEIQNLLGAVMVTLAAASNTAVKGGILVATGAKELRGIAFCAFGGMLLAAGGGLWLAWQVWA